MIIYKKDLKSNNFNAFDLHIKSIRPKKGQIIALSDLQGLITKVEVLEYDQRMAVGSYKIIDQVLQPKTKKRILIQAQIDKTYLEKLCELLPIINITNLIIIPSDLSQFQTINIDRLNNICTRSCEQSQNPYLPKIEIIKTSLVEYLKNIEEKPLILELPEKNNSKKIIESDCLLVGPEGGFSNYEMEFFKSNNYNQVSISKQVIPSWLAGYSYYSIFAI